MRSEKHCPHCGCELAAPGARSYPQIKRYFALVRAAFFHWPEDHARQFASAEELRAWLQMKAGHREIGATLPIAGMSRERAMLLAEAAIRGAGSNAFPVLHGDTLVIFRPKSISFSRMPHSDFCRLSEAIENVIRAEMNIDPDALLKEKAA